jgi:hypothetical protein
MVSKWASRSVPVSKCPISAEIIIEINLAGLQTKMLIKHGAWFAAEHRRTLLVATAVICPRRVASGGGGGLDASGKHHDDDEIKMEKQVDFYR